MDTAVGGWGRASRAPRIYGQIGCHCWLAQQSVFLKDVCGVTPSPWYSGERAVVRGHWENDESLNPNDEIITNHKRLGASLALPQATVLRVPAPHRGEGGMREGVLEVRVPGDRDHTHHLIAERFDPVALIQRSHMHHTNFTHRGRYRQCRRRRPRIYVLGSL